MNHTYLSHRRRAAAALACAASAAAAVPALTPAAASASSAQTCRNKSVAIRLAAGRTAHVPVKAISVQGGVSCAQAYTVIAKVLGGKPPSGWKSAAAHFKVPEGLAAQEVRDGGRIIRYAIHPG